MRIVLVVAALVLLSGDLRAQDSLPALIKDVGIDQNLGAHVRLDLPFHDETGHGVTLGRYFREKPVILILAYYRCPMLCNQVLNGVADCLEAPDFPLKLGDDFQIVTVSFDAREDKMPDLVAQKKANYVAAVEDFGHPRAADGWHFLTGEQAAIDELARTVGFRYVYDKKLDQFAHGSGIMVLTPEGQVSSYFYGIEFTAQRGQYATRDLKMGLIEASHHQIGSLADRTMLWLCYHYDPATGKYTMAVLNLVRAGGVATILALVLFFAWMWRRRRRSVGWVESSRRTGLTSPQRRQGNDTVGLEDSTHPTSAT
jgi:protein SCO1/2